jgi:hypothetical protein
MLVRCRTLHRMSLYSQTAVPLPYPLIHMKSHIVDKVIILWGLLRCPSPALTLHKSYLLLEVVEWIYMPIACQITNKRNSDYRRCWKWSQLFLSLSLLPGEFSSLSLISLLQSERQILAEQKLGEINDRPEYSPQMPCTGDWGFQV